MVKPDRDAFEASKLVEVAAAATVEAVTVDGLEKEAGLDKGIRPTPNYKNSSMSASPVALFQSPHTSPAKA